MFEWIKAKLALFEKSTEDLWEQNKLFFIIFGVLIITWKLRNLIIDLLINNSKEIFKNAENKSDQLKQEIDKLNNEANSLIKKAGEKNKDQDPVDEDWYKK